MNKLDLINAVEERLDVSPKVARASVDAVLDSIARALVEGDDVLITGFGTFSAVERSERKARNPQTGEEVRVPARRGIRFRPGARLLEHLRGEKALPADGCVVGKAPRTRKTEQTRDDA